jgi:hypothetical protein
MSEQGLMPREPDDTVYTAPPSREASAAEAAPTSSDALAFHPRVLAENARYLFTRPLHLDRGERWGAAGVLAGTLALYGWRDEIREEARSHGSEDRRRVLDAARTMGKGAVAPAVALAAGASYLGTRNAREVETSALVLQSAAYSALFAGIGSFVLSAERPRDGDEVRFFRSGGHGVSLDASLAASIVPPLRRQYLRVRPGDGRARRFWKRAATGALYAGAIGTALQRVDSDAHWAPDAFLGVVNGLVVGETLCDAREPARNPRAISWTLAPGGRAGLQVTARIPLGP